MAMARSSQGLVPPGRPFLPGLSACGRLAFGEAGWPDDDLCLTLGLTACPKGKQNTAAEREQASGGVSRLSLLGARTVSARSLPTRP